MSTERATRSTYKGHGTPEEFLYFGRTTKLTRTEGELLHRVERAGSSMSWANSAGRIVLVTTGATKFWAVPVA